MKKLIVNTINNKQQQQQQQQQQHISPIGSIPAVTGLQQNNVQSQNEYNSNNLRCMSENYFFFFLNLI